VSKIGKDKIIGACVMVIGILIGIIYTLGSIVDLVMESSFGGVIAGGFSIPFLTQLLTVDIFSWELFVVAPLWLIVVLIAVIAVWIGYSMLTVPQHLAENEYYACSRPSRSVDLNLLAYSKNWKRS
jgi:hypothetical protein